MINCQNPLPGNPLFDGYEVFNKVFHFFEGNEEAALEFYHKKHRAFGDRTILSLIAEGRKEEVLNYIGRLEHGVFT